MDWVLNFQKDTVINLAYQAVDVKKSKNQNKVCLQSRWYMVQFLMLDVHILCRQYKYRLYIIIFTKLNLTHVFSAHNGWPHLESLCHHLLDKESLGLCRWTAAHWSMIEKKGGRSSIQQ